MYFSTKTNTFTEELIGLSDYNADKYKMCNCNMVYPNTPKTCIYQNVHYSKTLM